MKYQGDIWSRQWHINDRLMEKSKLWWLKMVVEPPVNLIRCGKIKEHLRRKLPDSENVVLERELREKNLLLV